MGTPGIHQTVPQGVAELIAEQAASSPEAKAAVLDGEYLTYSQLDRRSNQVAHGLINRGIARGDLVAVQLDRSLDLVVTLLGILKAGAAYVAVLELPPETSSALIIEQLADHTCTVAPT